jgi:predicted lysophospholipase L1 biosynthesis ABC-type transport system permease subunit
VLIGVAIGLVGAIGLRRFTESMLYGIAPDDPLPLLSACAVLVLVAVLATLLPARQATHVDPMVAMREDG